MSDWHSCDPDAGGKQLCSLGFQTKTIQLRGASGSECEAKKRLKSKWWEHTCEVMVIGEAPGYEEENRGVPFVGRSGDKLFEKFLKPAGFDLDKVFITNAVKCRPPQLRSPAPEEVKACRPHIEWEIRHFQPKLVILAGNIALRVFNLHNKGNISYIHGKLFELKFPGWEDGPTFKVIPVFHPAYFLRKSNPRLERRILQDFHYAKKILDGKETKYNYYIPEYKVCLTLEEVEELARNLNEASEFAFDTESVSLPWSRHPLTMISFAWGHPGKCAVLPLSRHDPDGSDYKVYWVDKDFREKALALVRIPFENKSIDKIAHNIKYDSNVLRKWAQINVQGFEWDTCLMGHILHEQGPHGLEYLSDLEFGVGDYSASLRAIVGQGSKIKKTYDHVPDDVIWPYTCTDAECSYRLKQVFLSRLEKKPWLLNLYKQETEPISRVLRKAEWWGHRIDIEVLNDLLAEYAIKEEESLAKIYSIAGEGFNPRSSKDVIAKLKQLGFSNDMRDEKRTRGFRADREVLECISDQCELARHLLEYRGIKKIRSTYLENLKEDLDEDGRIRYSWLIHGTESGRLSCRLLHQAPRSDTKRTEEGKPSIRDIFTVEDDFMYFYADYDQIELRCLAIIANDEELLKVFASGEDVHKATAAAALQIPVDKVSDTNRQLGKQINFGVSYGSKGYKLSKNNFYEDPRDGKIYPLELSKIQIFLKAFLDKYKGIDRYLQYVPLEAASYGGTIRSVFGRERRISGLTDPDPKIRAHAEREAVNFTIQNPAAAITIRTAILTDQILASYNIGEDKIRMIQHVHDSISYEVHKSYLDWFEQAFVKIAENPFPELGNHSFPISYGIGRSWGEAERNSKRKKSHD